MTTQKLLERLDGVREIGPRKWVAKCPAHADKRASLSIREPDDGRTLLHDFAGCAATDVIAAVGLEFCDLFPPRTVGGGRPAPTHQRPQMSTRAAQERLGDAAHEAAVIAVILSDIDRGESVSAEVIDRYVKAAATLLELARPTKVAS